MAIKKNAKTVMIALLTIIIILSGISMVTGRSLVLSIFEGNKNVALGIKAKPGDELNLFSKFDFTKDKWKAYLIISSDDFSNLNPLIKKRTCLKTTDRHLLEEMKKSWRFKVTEGDIATVESELFLFKNNKLVFRTGIVLDKDVQRLQNEEYGELVPVNSSAIINSCKQFKKVYWPVVVF